VLMKELESAIISKQTYRALRGYDHEMEEDRITEESRANGDVGAGILGLLAQNRPFNRGI